MNRKGQGAIEYLIIIGGAIVIAVIVLSILVGFGTGQKEVVSQAKFDALYQSAKASLSAKCGNNQLDSITLENIEFQEPCDLINGTETIETSLTCRSLGINKDGTATTTSASCNTSTCQITGYTGC